MKDDEDTEEVENTEAACPRCDSPYCTTHISCARIRQGTVAGSTKARWRWVVCYIEFDRSMLCYHYYDCDEEF